MIRKAAGLLLAGLAALAPAHGQTLKPSGKTIVLKAARLFDGKSGALVKPGVVVVTAGKSSRREPARRSQQAGR